MRISVWSSDVCSSDLLGQFIDACPSDERADTGDTRVAAARLHDRFHLLGVRAHASKLQHMEGAVVIPLARLTEEHRAGAVELDRDGHEPHTRPDQREGRKGQDLVLQPFSGMAESTEKRRVGKEYVSTYR